MWKVTWKGLVQNKRRVVGTAISVIIGVAFLAGTYVFTDTIRRTFDALFADVNATTDAYVRSTSVLEGDFGFTSRKRVPDALLDTVAAVPEVAEVSGDVQGFAMIIDKDGDPIGNPDNGAPTFGGDLSEGELTPWRLEDGSSFPVGPDQVVIDKASADKGDYEIGDTVPVAAQAGVRTFTLVGIARFGSTDAPGGATYALFERSVAQEFIGKPGELDAVRARAADGVSQEELVSAIEQAVGSDVEVLTGAQITEENQDDIAEGLSFFQIMLTVFAVIALFVSSFIIYNTFSILVAQRQRETALMRALGASRRQIVGSVVAESVVVGLVASALGLLGGIGMASVLKGMLSALGIDIPSGGTVLLPRTVILSLVVGLVLTLVSAVGPALRASRVPPVAAMRSVAVDNSATSRVRFLSGVLIASIGALAIGAGLSGAPIIWLGLGIAAMFIGVFVLGPLLARPVARVIGWPMARFAGITGNLARQNAMRNPKRTARTAAALMVGVALVAGISVLAASTKASVRGIFEEQFTGDFVVVAKSQQFGGLPVSLAAELNELPEVGAATGIQVALANVNGNDRTITVVDPATAGDLFDLEFVDGSLDDLGTDTVAISTNRRDSDNLAIGDTVTVRFTDGVERPLKVSGIYDKDELAGGFTVASALYEQTGGDQFHFSVYVNKAEGVSDADASAAISGVVDDYPVGDFKSRDQYIDDQAAQIDSFVNLIYGLLMLAVIIAALGISNTLQLSIHERTRELGLLRAVGTTRRQVRRMVRGEAIITALLGTVQGVVIGIALGYAVIVALRDEGLDKFTIPVSGIVLVTILALVIGVGASIRPARRATKLDVLDALVQT